MSVITTISSSAPSTTPALPAPVTSPRSTTPRPSTRAGGSAPQGRHTLRRRLVASLLAILGAVALTLGMGTGAQASGGLPDCVHGVLGKTALDTSLPANDPRTSGTVISQWLYRSNGRQWVYTGVSTGARAYAGGIWMSGGHMVNELTFYMTPGSGYYIVLEQITRSGQQPVTFWQTYYRQLPGNYYLGYCQA